MTARKVFAATTVVVALIVAVYLAWMVVAAVYQLSHPAQDAVWSGYCYGGRMCIATTLAIRCMSPIRLSVEWFEAKNND